MPVKPQACVLYLIVHCPSHSAQVSQPSFSGHLLIFLIGPLRLSKQSNSHRLIANSTTQSSFLQQKTPPVSSTTTFWSGGIFIKLLQVELSGTSKQSSCSAPVSGGLELTRAQPGTAAASVLGDTGYL